MPRNRSEKSLSGDKIVDAALATLETYRTNGTGFGFGKFVKAYGKLSLIQQVVYAQFAGAIVDKRQPPD